MIFFVLLFFVFAIHTGSNTAVVQNNSSHKSTIDSGLLTLGTRMATMSSIENEKYIVNNADHPASSTKVHAMIRVVDMPRKNSAFGALSAADLDIIETVATSDPGVTASE